MATDVAILRLVGEPLGGEKVKERSPLHIPAGVQGRDPCYKIKNETTARAAV